MPAPWPAWTDHTKEVDIEHPAPNVPAFVVAQGMQQQPPYIGDI